jgi:hypothetical protein
MAPLPTTLDRRLLAAVALAAALAAVYLQRQADADLWGHLRYGQLFLDARGPVSTDLFAYTTTGRHWSTHEYLAQMLLAAAYGWAGPVGLIALKCLLGAAAIGCLYAALRTATADARLWAPLLMLCALSLGRWYQFRPQLFTYVLFAFFVVTLFRYLVGRPARLWLLPLLMPLWVNLHGGFLAGLGAVGLALAGRLLQTYNREGFRLTSLCRAAWPLLAVLAASLAGSLLNPMGWRLWPYLATEFGHAANKKYLQEWQQAWHANELTVLLLALTLALLLLLTFLAQQRISRIAGLAPWQWAMSCLPLTAMALQSMRHIPIFTIWVTPMLGLLAQAAASPGHRSWNVAWLTLSGLIMVPAVQAVLLVCTDPLPRIGVDKALGNTSPHNVVAFLRTYNLAGKLYTPLWWGSYFTWELEPNILVSMDGRNVTLFAPEDVTANLVFYLDPDPDLETPLQEQADFLVVPADASVLVQVRRDSRWLPAYEDDQASLFVRATSANRWQAEQHWDKRDRLRPADLLPSRFLR